MLNADMSSKLTMEYCTLIIPDSKLLRIWFTDRYDKAFAQMLQLPNKKRLDIPNAA